MASFDGCICGVVALVGAVPDSAGGVDAAGWEGCPPLAMIS